MIDLDDDWDAEGPPESSPFHDSQMPRGVPRPRSTDGRRLPVPYIAAGLDQLGTTNALRRMLAVTDRRCQVCGEKLPDEAIVCARPGDTYVIDGAGVCPHPCWEQARRLCPHLASLAAEGRLEVWKIPTATLYTGLVRVGGSQHNGYLIPREVPNHR